VTWTVRISSHAERELRHLDRGVTGHIKDELQALAGHDNPLESNRQVKALQGNFKGFFRLRLGDLRLLFALVPEQHVIAVVHVAPRSESYRAAGALHSPN
jgi:mRNA interferase RelE/StbE